MAPRRCLGANGNRCTNLVTNSSRCPTCRATRDRGRGTRQARGYNAAHDQARRTLGATLPAPCGYCGQVVHPTQRWDAAHLVDGQPEFGWMVAHPRCNQAARARAHRPTP